MSRICVVLIGLVPMCAMAQSEKFTDVRIEAPFREVLLNNPMLMEFAGAKLIRVDNKQVVLLSVAATDVRGESAKEQLRRKTVCRSKALAHLLKREAGDQVTYYSRLEDSHVVRVENGTETGQAMSEFFELIENRASGIVQTLPVVGTWRSSGGDVFYVALGRVFDSDPASQAQSLPDTPDN